MAGKLTLLAEDTLYLSGKFNQILAENAADRYPLDLSHPLTRDLLFMDAFEQTSNLPWQRVRLMGFRDRCNAHRSHVVDLALSDFKSGILEHPLPNDLKAAEVSTMLAEHRSALLDRARSIVSPYAKILRKESQ